MQFSVASVSEHYLKERESFNDTLRIRIHRSLSWLKKAYALKDDPDLCFILLWISFNAAYGREIHLDSTDKPYELTGDRVGFKRFLIKLCEVDTKHLIYDLVWKEYSGAIRVLLANKFSYQTFWEYQKGKLSTAEIEEKLELNQKMVQDALAHLDTQLVLSLIFDRLYCVRNQLIHGGSTYASSVNRAQINDGVKILSHLLPLMLEIMMQNAKEDWGEVLYPPYPND